MSGLVTFDIGGVTYGLGNSSAPPGPAPNPPPVGAVLDVSHTPKKSYRTYSVNVQSNVDTLRITVDGKPVLFSLVQSPTVEDILGSEARVQATMIERGTISPDRRVSRELRDFLIRLGVEK
jgi:hypothetical protein